MKLVELLVKHITEWPKGVNYFVQDYDGEVKAGASGEEELPVRRDAVWIRPAIIDEFRFGDHTCSDWDTAIVTESMWRTEKCKPRGSTMNSTTTFETAKVGDKVWSIEYGWGVIQSTSHTYTNPILVRFAEDDYMSFKLSGSQFHEYRHQTLFWDEIKFEAPQKPLPDLEVDAKVLVWSRHNKVKRHFSHFDEEGRICAFDHGRSSFTTKDYTAWPNWELAE